MMRATDTRLFGTITPEDLTVSFLPMAHVGEQVCGFFGRLNVGLRTAYATSYEKLFEEVAEVRPTLFGGVPRIFEKFYGRIREGVARASPRRQAIFAWAARRARRRARAAFGGTPLSLRERLAVALADRLVFRKIRAIFGGRVKMFIAGAAPTSPDILEFFYGMGVKIYEVYGLSEASGISFGNTLLNHRLGTVGKAIDGLEVKLGDDGEILLKGPTVFPGYLNRPDENMEAFDRDGFLRTGDIGELDKDGFLRITDRKKNLLKTAGGKFVAPARIEALVKESEPLVSQVYVHGDQKPYVVVLVTLDPRDTTRVAKELGVEEATLHLHPEVRRRIDGAIQRANQKLGRWEQVKRHAILPRDFSIEDGTVTVTLKIKRRAVAEKYAREIEALYAEDPAHQGGGGAEPPTRAKAEVAH
jgi:long-chain acyl-CoA synthetase